MNGKIISGPAAVFVIVLFFLPWVSVSCDGEELGTLNGMQLATGTVPEESDDVLESSDLGGEPILFIVPLAGAVALLLMVIALWKKGFAENAGWGRIIVALLGVLVLVLEWLQLQSQNESGFEILLEPAMWGTLACLVLIGSGGLLDVILLNRRPSYARSLGARSQQEKHPYRPTIIANRDDIADQLGGGSHTILDDGLGGDMPYGSATILDDSFTEPDQYGSATILDEDFTGPADYGSETILDEDFVSGGRVDGGATILDEALLADEGTYDGATILDDQLLAGAEDDNHTILSERRGGMPVPRSPEASPPEPERVAIPEPPPDLPPIVTTDKTEILHVEPDMLAWLVIGSGDRTGEQFQLKNDNSIGRDSSNDIVLDDTALSARHVQIRLENRRVYATDQQSTNGLYVLNGTTGNWERQESCELRHGSQIKLGRIVLQLVIAGEK